MTPTQPPAAPKPPVSGSGLQRLDAYRVAVDFYRLLRAATRGRRGHVVDQLCRAAESVVLNIAEAYPAIGADRARRFRIAGNEAAECHAALDLLEIRGDLATPALSQLRSLLDRERAMLWRLKQRPSEAALLVINAPIHHATGIWRSTPSGWWKSARLQVSIATVSI